MVRQARYPLDLVVVAYKKAYGRSAHPVLQLLYVRKARTMRSGRFRPQKASFNRGLVVGGSWGLVSIQANGGTDSGYKERTSKSRSFHRWCSIVSST